MLQKNMRRSEWLTLAVILLAAALLRLSNLTEIEHNVDHAYPVWQALATLEQGYLPLIGQGTSVLFANPALTGYLYLPAVALTRSPIGVYLFVIALNTLAVLLAYRAVSRLLGVRVGLVAAALLAVNPWVIEYSRTSWVQSLLPFFTAALAWMLWPVLAGKTNHPARRLLIAAALLTVMSQTYLLAFLMAVPVGLLLLIFWRRLPRRPVFVGAAIFITAATIYGAGLLNQRDTVTQQMSAFSSGTPTLSAEAWGHAVRLISGGDYPLARGTQAPTQDWQTRQVLSQIGHYIMLAALVAGIGLAVYGLLRPTGDEGNSLPNHRDTAIILLVWFGLPVALMSYVGQIVHPFYLLLVLPAGHALAAWALVTVLRRPVLLAALLIPFGLLLGINSQRYYQETAAIPGAHGLGALPVDVGLQLGQAINTHLPSGGIVYADVDQWTLNSFAGTIFPVIRDTRAPQVTIIPASGGLYITAQPDQPDAPPTGANRAAVLTLADGTTLRVDRFAPGTPPISQPLEIRSEQGLTLLGYDLNSTGDTHTLTTYWRVDDVPGEGGDYAPFVHVFDAAGQRVRIIDGQPIPIDRWQMGDIHIHRHQFEIAAPFTLATGQYDSLRGANIIFLPDYTPLIELD